MRHTSPVPYRSRVHVSVRELDAGTYITPSILRDLSQMVDDPAPVFAAYIIGEQGLSFGTIHGRGATSKRWTRRAIAELVQASNESHPPVYVGHGKLSDAVLVVTPMCISADQWEPLAMRLRDELA